MKTFSPDRLENRVDAVLGNIITPDTYFDRIYVLNLARRPDREISILQKLRDQNIHNFERISAVDGLKISIPEACLSPKMSKGAWGYLLSWEKILNKARKEGKKRILCFDDDIIFHRDFSHQFHNLVQWLPNDWKILNLGASQHIDIDIPDDTAWYHPGLTDGSFATGVDCTAFLPLLTEIRRIKSYLKMTPSQIIAELAINPSCIMPLDSGPLREIYLNDPENCYVAYPNLIISDVRNSSIRGPRDQNRIAEKFGWNLSNYHWPPEMDLVSIVISCYNGERTIKKSVLSARLQDYSNCEVIVVDDCSKDDSAQILKEALHAQDIMVAGIPRKLHPLRILRNTENMGCYATRNRGIMASRGKWVTFQDADDISVQERITFQLAALMRHKVLFTTCLILRSHLPDFSTITKYDRDSVLKTLEPTRIHRQRILLGEGSNGGDEKGVGKEGSGKEGVGKEGSGKEGSGKEGRRIRTLAGSHKYLSKKDEHHANEHFKYCCRGILGMVTTLFPREIFYEVGLYWTLPCTADAEFCERVLYNKADKLFMGDESVVTFLSQNTHIPEIYYRVGQILYISEEMRSENLTSQIKGNRALKEEFVHDWRARLLGNHEYEYPTMT